MLNEITEINIKADMPSAKEAIDSVSSVIEALRCDKPSVVKLIHGYGSTGKGGKIRVELRNYLSILERNGLIDMYIEGENWDIFNIKTQKMLLKFSYLSKDSDLNRHNNGITIIIF